MPVGLLAVAREEIPPPRAHVPRHVFHDRGDGIRFRIQSGKERIVRSLLQRAIPQQLVIAEETERVFYVVSCEFECHARILQRWTEKIKREGNLCTSDSFLA